MMCPVMGKKWLEYVVIVDKKEFFPVCYIKQVVFTLERGNNNGNE